MRQAERSERPGRRQELREFLMNRRARVSPAEAGLPDGGRRRTPGLRREEVAVLAGVGASWYQWLEQGRDISVSPQVLDAVARVLRLNPAERRHLYVLAGLNPPLLAPEADDSFCEGLQRLIDAWMPFPAHIMDAYWNIVAHNESARLTFGYDEQDSNCLISFFLNPVYRGRCERREELAASVVAQYRAALAEHPDDEGYRAVVDELLTASEEFAALWARGDAMPSGQMHKSYEHPTVGTLSFESSQMRLQARPDLIIVMHNPLPGTDTAAKLERLTSPRGRRETLRTVAS
ncbi:MULTISPECIES: helix-turn-helix transcriptional regulator [Streptomycetaceae]|uniref:Helix-turn-helix domain protein n=1 Tax=Streptantibioticus cattleyicolor (strain ATCC 35852 / DSM 46488 / JCM 4925 / NBRC 14057 / NRRL 8057) TaxID=1003195 RepID=F8JP15_STREN|nr:helix-turn-helix transcriptional regulator [Streptantibioticus cattleyicolor]AEW93957.1 helix-turn-helix domain protein [Streptantibioticus cattleyicolor NRRL 8057 = DSM 46488]MYS58633.1 helix-turn-helix domain-containing protein [Streptomyces sp. SID5468]CCB74303.1 DNA-binding protein [Streptantibioticus cattleyicolor NRRL 8057 = DSM 46488]